jgi:hypothetical protein
MAVIIFDESVGILKGIHRQYRTALLNKKYYGYRLEVYKFRNFWLEVLIAVGATGAGGTGVAGLTVWKTGVGVVIWAVLSAVSIVLATVKPFLGWPTLIERYSKLWSEYATMHAALQQIEEDLQTNNCLRTEQVEAFGKIRDRMPELAQLDDPHPDMELVARFEQEVKAEVPVTSLWMPRRPAQGVAPATPAAQKTTPSVASSAAE